MTIPEYALFAAAVADHRFWIALAIAILAGVVRGFSGFGSAQNNVITVRANFLVYFLLLGLTSCAVYFWQGLFTSELLALALLLAIPFFLATAIGAKYFHGASDKLYRRIAYAIIALAALVSLPLFDNWLR